MFLYLLFSVYFFLFRTCVCLPKILVLCTSDQVKGKVSGAYTTRRVISHVAVLDLSLSSTWQLLTAMFDEAPAGELVLAPNTPQSFRSQVRTAFNINIFISVYTNMMGEKNDTLVRLNLVYFKFCFYKIDI